MQIRISQLRNSNIIKISFLLLGILISGGAGLSYLFYPSSYTPLILAGGITTLASVIFIFLKPEWAIYAALFFVLMPQGLIPISLNSLLNRVLTVAAFVTWLVMVIVKKQRIRWTLTSVLMLVFIVIGMISLLWARNLDAGFLLMQVYFLRFLFYLFLIPNEIRTKNKLNQFMNVLAVAGWLLLGAGLNDLLRGGYFPGIRLQVLNIDENEYGVLLLVTMQGVLWQAMRPSRKSHWLAKLMPYIFITLALVLVATSGSRGSAISLGVTLMMFLVWKPTRRWGTLGFFLLMAGLIIAPVIFQTTIDRFMVQTGDTALGGREPLWSAAWQIIVQHPLRGVGIGNSSYEIMPYLSLLRAASGHTSVSMHNPVLVIWSETGFPGIIIYLSILASSIGSFAWEYYRYRKAGGKYLLSYFAIIGAVFCGYIISWIKGGGMESVHSYFLMLSVLLIPSGMYMNTIEGKESAEARSTVEEELPSFTRKQTGLNPVKDQT